MQPDGILHSRNSLQLWEFGSEQYGDPYGCVVVVEKKSLQFAGSYQNVLSVPQETDAPRGTAEGCVVDKVTLRQKET